MNCLNLLQKEFAYLRKLRNQSLIQMLRMISTNPLIFKSLPGANPNIDLQRCFRKVVQYQIEVSLTRCRLYQQRRSHYSITLRANISRQNRRIKSRKSYSNLSLNEVLRQTMGQREA